jgi:hypothetical protein
VGGQRHAPAALSPGKIQYPLHRRLGRPHGRPWQVQKISPPPEFDPRTVQPVASRYTDWAIPAHISGLSEDIKFGALNLTAQIDKRKDFRSKYIWHKKNLKYNQLFPVWPRRLRYPYTNPFQCRPNLVFYLSIIRFNIILSALGSPNKGPLSRFSYCLIVRPYYRVFCNATHLAVLVSIIDKESDFVNSCRQKPWTVWV